MKKSLTLLLALAVCFTMCFSAVPAYAAEEAPTGTPIASEADLRAMESNPAGEYYLAADLSLTPGFRIFTNKEFTGTLDGNGHSISMYTANTWHLSYEGGYNATIAKASGATFKNLNIEGTSMSQKQWGNGVSFGGLVGEANNCTFTSVDVQGDTVINGSFDKWGGIAAYAKGCTFSKCEAKGTLTSTGNQHVGRLVYSSGGSTYKTCKSKGTVSVTNPYRVMYYGIASGDENDKYSSCTNSAAVTISGNDIYVGGIGDSGKFTSCKNLKDGKITVKALPGTETINVGGVTGGTHKTTTSKCSNSAAISVTMDGDATAKISSGFGANVGGVGASAAATSCKNTGKVTLKINSPVASYTSNVSVGGVTGGTSASKSTNTGAITYSDKGFGRGGIRVGGVIGSGTVTQSYNTGAVKATTAAANESILAVGGLAGGAWRLDYSANTGSVTMKGKGYVGGLCGTGSFVDKICRYNYSTGKITGGTKYTKGALIGYYSGAFGKRVVKDNYTTQSTKMYGSEDRDWKDYVAQGKKVSKISKNTCPKLTSKYWKSKDGKWIPKNAA